LAAKGNPEVYEVLDIFNTGFGVKLLIINGENVQVDPSAYQRLLSNQAMSLAKSVFPNNILQQLVVYGASQRQIQKTCQAIRPDIESRTVPLEKMTALIASNGHKIAKRSLEKDVLSDVIAAVESTVCNTLVDYAFTQLNNTLTSVTNFLDTITLSSGDNVLVALISFALDYVEQVIEGFREIAESLTSSICSELFDSSSDSRKRRDVDTELAEFGTRDILTRDIFSALFGFVWSLIAGILNPTLKNLWDSLITVIESYFATLLEGTATDWIYAVIDSVFS
jgi:hypothetical protein